MLQTMFFSININIIQYGMEISTIVVINVSVFMLTKHLN